MPVYAKKNKLSNLHPLQKNPQGEIFHNIDEIFIEEDGIEKSKSVNVQVFREGMGSSKKDFYLFKGEKTAKKLVIDSHGQIDSKNKTITHLKKNFPIITFLGPHRKMLSTSIISDETSLLDIINKPYAKVSYKEISFYSEQALNKSYKHITGTKTKKAVRNYQLSKVETDASRTFTKHELHGRALNVDHSHKNNRDPQDRYDILTLRKHVKNITSGDIINFAQSKGYEEVIFFFCRHKELDDKTDKLSDEFNDPNTTLKRQIEIEKTLLPYFYNLEETTALNKPKHLKWKFPYPMKFFNFSKPFRFFSCLLPNKKEESIHLLPRKETRV